MPLPSIEKKVRTLLIRVAKGKYVASRTRGRGRISYKEVWKAIYPKRKWGQAHTLEVVEWITSVSAYELQNGRPPLNEIVTPINKLVPQDPWGNSIRGIKAHLKKLSGVSSPHSSHEEAQEACWRYWVNHSDNGSLNLDIPITESEADEGYRQDREARFIKRNKRIIAAAKKRDKYKCRACGFFIEVDGKPLIDCHHTIPLSHSPSGRVTKLSDLVCLCPTCHRIAHTKAYPRSVDEIRKCRGL